MDPQLSQLAEMPLSPLAEDSKKERKRTQPAQKVSCLHKDRHHYAKGRCSECYRRGAQVDKLTQAWKEEYGNKTVCLDFNAAAKSIIHDWKEGKITDSSFQISQYLNGGPQPQNLAPSIEAPTTSTTYISSPTRSSTSSALAQLSASFTKSQVLSPTAYKAIHHPNDDGQDSSSSVFTSDPAPSTIDTPLPPSSDTMPTFSAQLSSALSNPNDLSTLNSVTVTEGMSSVNTSEEGQHAVNTYNSVHITEEGQNAVNIQEVMHANISQDTTNITSSSVEESVSVANVITGTKRNISEVLPPDIETHKKIEIQ